jgi:cobalt-zinc-cadmium efflux system outer membrane protein
MSTTQGGRAAAWLAALLWIPLLCAADVLPATEGVAVDVLPPAASVVQVLARAPVYLAARSQVEADRFVRRQLVVGAYEWTGTAYAARRNQSQPVNEQTAEWDVGVERAIRLPGKALISEQLGDSRLAQAQAIQHRAWREQARLLLESHASWLREREHARVWKSQAVLWQRQLDAVTRRQRLGDAARIEQRQAEAALAQAKVQSDAAQLRAASARESLERQFPGLVLPFDTAIPPSELGPLDDAHWLPAQLSANPDIEVARQETRVADAQLRLDSAERRPDPTVGVRLGQQRNANERFVGVTLSVPFGGEYRAAAAAATGARAVAASLREWDAQRKGEVDAVMRVREAQAALAAAVGNSKATAQLQEVASSLQRGYALGEGSLTDILTAQRLANEQQLLAARSSVDALTTRYRLELESGLLWPEPESNNQQAP